MSEEAEGQPENHGSQDRESPASEDLDDSDISRSQAESPTDWQEYISRANETTPNHSDSSSTTSAGFYEHPPTSVLTQTDSSWLLAHKPALPKKSKPVENGESEFFSQLSTYFSSGNEDRDAESIREDDVSDATSKGSLDEQIVHSEFIDKESEKLFQPAAYTLPNVGLPTILAYKQESKEKPIDYNAIRPKVKSDWLHKQKELHDVKEYWQWKRNMLVEAVKLSTRQPKWDQFRKSVVSVGFDLCQFCGKNLKPLPTPKQLSTEVYEKLFCCKQYQDLFEFLMREEELTRLKTSLEMIDISPHLPFSSLIEREQAKEKAAMRLRDREMEKMMKKTKENQHRLSAGPKKLTTITFHLSTSLDFVTLKETHVDDGDWDNILTEAGDDIFSWNKDLPSSFMVKYYKNGNKFLTAFPDGMAQIFYPSGNLAVQIFTDQQKKICCIVQEDRADEPAIRAVFTSYGRCTCYHPNGVVW
ncbi:glutamate-rich protein 6 [Mustelus asterias]